MIHFLSFLYCCFSYGTCNFCVCILYTVSCHNYMYYVCETYKMLENVGKRCEFEYTREQRYTKVIYYYYYIRLVMVCARRVMILCAWLGRLKFNSFFFSLEFSQLNSIKNTLIIPQGAILLWSQRVRKIIIHKVKRTIQQTKELL